MRKKKRAGRLKKLLFLVLCFFVIPILILKFYNPFLSKKTYVSPLPFSRKPTSQNITDQVKDLLKKNNINFSSVRVSSDSSVIIYYFDSEVLLSPKNSLDKQISSLQLVLSRLTIEGKRFSKLDLRFDKPVIVFE